MIWQPKKPIWRRALCPHCGYEGSALEGDWIKERRSTKELSQDELASLLGVTRAYICLLEKNRRNGTPITHAKIVEALK